MTTKEVIKAPPVEIWLKENAIQYHKTDSNGYHYYNKDKAPTGYFLISPSWCLGGTYGNCWGSELGQVSASEPEEHIEFDALMEKLCPNISFLAYKRYLRETTEQKTYTDGDYYGGRTERAYWITDLSKLYDLLVADGIIQPVK